MVAEAGEEPVEPGLVCGGEPGPLVSSGVRRSLTLLADEAPTAQTRQLMRKLIETPPGTRKTRPERSRGTRRHTPFHSIFSRGNRDDSVGASSLR